MKLSLRPYQTEEDYWRMRAFLRETLPINGFRQRNWDVVRWDYWRWHVNENIFHFPLSEVVFIWEAEDGRIAAAVTADGPDDVFLQVHPALRSAALETEMLAVAESHFPAGKRKGSGMRLWASRADDLRRSMLRQCGYVQAQGAERQHRRDMSIPIMDVPLAAGFTIRPVAEVDDLPGRSYLSWQAFHPDEPDERYQGWEWYLNVQRAPLYRRELDLMAIAPDGTPASFCTLWFDDANRTAVFEPVGTAPRFQRMGLGKAVMTEGLRQIKRLGARYAYVGSYSERAGALYASVGLSDDELCDPWIRQK